MRGLHRFRLASTAGVAALVLAPPIALFLGGDRGRSAASAPGPSGRLSIEGEAGGDLDVAFGTIRFGETGERAFSLANAGEGNLRLSKGTTSCGCTVAGFGEGEALRPEALLKPGEATRLVVRWTPKQPGAFLSQARIKTDDPSRPEVTFRVHGEAQTPIMLKPAGGGFRFPEIAKGETKRATLTLVSPDRPGFRVLDVRSSRPEMVEASFRAAAPEDPSATAPAPGFAIDVALRAPAATGSFREELIVTTDHPLKPELRIPVTGERVGPVRVAPRRLRIVASKARGGLARAILTARGEIPTRFEVVEAPEGMVVAVEPIGDAGGASRRHQLTASIPPGATPRPTDGSIVLGTNHPEEPTVVIPVVSLMVGSR